MNQDEELKKLRASLNLLAEKQAMMQQELGKLNRQVEEFAGISKPVAEVKTPVQVMTPPAAEELLNRNPEVKSGKTGIAGLERFIGVNLVSFSGIIILLAGLGIGINYAIQHGLLAPLVRFILGYVAGLLLIGAGLRFLSRYKSYASILLNGGMAVLYFNTYAAAGYYNFFPQWLAFAVMFILTAITVFIALRLDNQYTAIIGLVGAYGIPFLVGSESGAYWILPAYTIIINCGVLYIGFRKNWKVLNYVAFGMSWILFIAWLNVSDGERVYQITALIFSTLFFLIFYLLVLAYKLIRNETFQVGEVIVLLLNSFIYYLASLGIVRDLGDYAGMFTAGNAVLHGMVILIVYRRGIADKAFYRFLMGIFLAFLTLAIPMQFDGEWVCWLWALESLALYAAGRSGKQSFYAWISLGLMILASLALLVSWQRHYMLFPEQQVRVLTPFLNKAFLTSLVVITCAGVMFLLSRDREIRLQRTFGLIWTVFFLFLFYFAIRTELGNYWYSHYSQSTYEDGMYSFSVDSLALDMRHVTLFLYTVLFLGALSFLGRLRDWDESVKIIVSVMAGLVLVRYAILVLPALDDMRSMFHKGEESMFNPPVIIVHLLRYIAYGGAAFLLVFVNRVVFSFEKEQVVKSIVSLLTHFFVLYLLSYELTILVSEAGGIYNGMAVHKAGYSILWGCYALFMVGSGFLRGRSLTRITGVIFVLFVACKVLLFDLSGLSTRLRILLLISLGVVMLIIAFVYQKNAAGKKGEV
ncbi:MAG: DUF2339 domain-containing protein [Bacteroidales bacterium]